jgi:predicted HAD superfamily Cof-like phosphohydrolase
MEKIDCLNQVAEFHKTFNAPILDKPQIPSKERCDLRATLLQEELDELKYAIKNNDLTEVSDACGDLMVILSGTILEFGLGEKFNDIFTEIHRSNMSKACSSQQEAIATLLHYKKKDGTEGYYKEINGKWIVYRKDDNKILKSINYSPANINELLQK